MRELDGVRELGRNGGWYRFVFVIVSVVVIGMTHGDPLLAIDGKYPFFVTTN